MERNRLVRNNRVLPLLLALILTIAGCEPEISFAAELAAEEIIEIAESLEDAAAKEEILEAVKDGAAISFGYTEDGRVKSYRIVREGVSKKHEEMTEEEKRQALELLIEQGVAENRILVNGTYYSLNQKLWMERGIVVYGETAEVNNKVSVTSGSNYKDGQYRFWGYDINGGLYGNDDFPRDSDSGMPAYEKDWLTTEEIKESAVARGYIGEHGMSANGRYSGADKRATAKAWLSDNPQWSKAGIDEEYILEHFYFNSVLSDSGLTTGQFTGVHLSKFDGKLYYQSFSVEGELPSFVITEGTVEERILIEEGDEDTGTEDDGSDEDDPEGAVIEFDVELGLPQVSYVGHPVTATDRTGFTVDGTMRSATRVYAEKLATNRFRLPDGAGTIRKNSSIPTKATATFSEEGMHRVELAVTAGGRTKTDAKSIEVLRTPAITHALTGTQKQNRAQMLSIWVATDPERPLEELWVEIRDSVTGETVHLEHHVGAESGLGNTLENTEGIKTRAIVGLESDELFTNCQLEFLMKNEEEREFAYTIYVRDAEGNTDRVVENFTVVPDLAPETSVKMDETFLRNQGGNRAVITVEDRSQTDGDQLEHSWSFVPLDEAGEIAPGIEYADLKTMMGYEDLSFGTGQNVQFLKDGVGKFRVRLDVRDVWAEPTLEEYVTEEDRKEAFSTDDGEVINVAPKVSLEAKEFKTAEILCLTSDDETFEKVQEQLPEVNAALLENGYDGKVTVQRMYPSKTSGKKPWEQTVKVNTPYGYRGSWIKLYEENNFIADDRRLYKIDATWLGSGSDFYPQEPYTITAWDGESGKVVWRYTFKNNVFSVDEETGYLAQDDSGAYLYLVSNGKTLILDKDTGAKLTVLPFAVGKECFAAQNRIFTVKGDGIYAIHTGTGAVTKVYSGLPGAGATRFAGQIQFVARVGETLYRSSLDPETQQVKLQKLSGVTLAVGTYDAAMFCTDGTLIVQETGEEQIRFLKFAETGELLKQVSHSAEEMVGTVVRNGSGNAEYVAVVESDESGDYDYVYVTCYNLSTGKSARTYLRNINGDPTMTRILAAEQDGSQVYVVTGAYYTWILNYGWATGPAHGYPQRTRTFRFDMTGLTGESVTNSTYGLDDTKEYGMTNDVYIAIQSSQNGQNQDPPSGNITALYRRYQTESQVEQRYRSRYLSRDGSVDRQEVFVLTGESLKTETLPQMVERCLEDVSTEQVSYVDLAETASGGNLQRQFSLLPDKTYYYEYEMYAPDIELTEAEDILSVTAGLSQRNTQLAGKQYRVVHKILEQFDNNKVGTDYFKGIQSANLVNDRWYAAPATAKAKLRNTSVSLNFTVDPGETAVLSFDYEIQRYTSVSYFGNHVLIDGKHWKLPLEEGGTRKGHYTHPFLLSEGNHTITLFAGTYGKVETFTAIDNLMVEYVELETKATLASENELVKKESSYVEEMGEGWVRVSGSFQTPMEVVAYQSVKGTVGTETAGAGTYSTMTTSTQSNKPVNFVIPSGETVIYASAATTSKPSKTSSKNYGVFWYVDGVSFSCNLDSYFDTNDDNRLKSPAVPTSFDFVMPVNGTSAPTWKNPNFKMYYGGTSSGTGGTLGKVVVASVKMTDTSTKNREYFLQPSGTNKGIYTGNLRFNSTAKIRFVPGGNGARGIAKLKIYTIENGSKVYVSESDIADAAELSRWTKSNVNAAVKTIGAPKEEEHSMIYAKGETVRANVFYSDYESDPSKMSYWKYTHLPYNDGAHPEATVIIDENEESVGGTGVILSEPITKFYVDGKYIVEHWQEDSTGDPAYDKTSNVAKMILYISGGGSAPWIESVVVQPSGPKEGDAVSAKVTINDREKDPLNLEIEIYRDGTRLLKQTVTNLTANARGDYPVTVSDSIGAAEAGKYEIVCTVRDDSGIGLGGRQFTIKPAAGSIEGEVSHTEAWDSNRRGYNLNLFGSNASLYNTPMTLEQYLGFSEPRPRGSNVFWAGEELILTAVVGGSPTSVIAEADGYTVRLSATGQKTADGKSIYRGALWSQSMRNNWGKTPEEVQVTFTSYYNKEEPKTHAVSIIVDSNTEYWLLHRYS